MGGVLWFRAEALPQPREQSRRGGCSPIQGDMEGSVDCSHLFRHRALNNPARLSPLEPLRNLHPILRHRRLTRTPLHLSQYHGQICPPM
jgi:hypothetical protein